jgi:hypothetical protein
VVPQGLHRDRTPPRGGAPARRECPKPRAKPGSSPQSDAPRA